MSDRSKYSSTVVADSRIEVTPGTCGGKPRIAGHRIRVQDIALWTEEGSSVDEIVASYPQLSLSDVYAALTYYHDHREQIDQDMRDDKEFFERMKARPELNRQQGPHGGDPLSP